MIERKGAQEFPLRIPPIPKDKLQEEFTWFWAALAVAGKEEAIDLLSEPMEQSSPKLQEFIKEMSKAVPANETALDFEMGAHFVYNLLCFVPLPYLRVGTIRRFETEFRQWQNQLHFLLERERGNESELLMKFLATRSTAFGFGGALVYELYTRELASRRMDRTTFKTRS